MHGVVPHFDISVVTCNAAARLPAFLESLLNQRLSLQGAGLYLRDNGSADGTMALLQDFARRHARRFREIHLQAGPRAGTGARRHPDSMPGEADFVLVAQADVALEPDCLELLLREAMRDAPQVAAWECRQKPFENPKDYDPATGETGWNESACVLYRRSALRAGGSYGKGLLPREADVELSCRLRGLGYRLRYVPRAAVWRVARAEPAASLPGMGDAMARVLLRCRFGGPREVVRGIARYLRLLKQPQHLPGKRARLALGLARLSWVAPRFLLLRRGGGQRIAHAGWAFGEAREGGLPPLPEAARVPLVSVLVRTMPGRGGCLREALASIAAQTHTPIHLVVVEDGGESARAQLDAARADGRFVEVSYLPLPKSGRCVAGNAALAAARGELVCFLDDDDLLYADHLETLAGAWAARPALGAVCGWALEVGVQVQSREPWVVEEKARQVLYRQAFDRALLWRQNYLPIQSVLFRRELFERHGGFDPELDQLEDWNLWVRYSLHGDFEMVPRVTSLFRVPAAPEQAQRRRASLEAYYPVAQAKHERLRLAAGLSAEH